MRIQWETPNRQSKAGCLRSTAQCRCRVHAAVLSRGFNIPLDEPGEIGESGSSVCEAIAPSNDELRRSLSQFEPPREWLDDSIEEQVW